LDPSLNLDAVVSPSEDIVAREIEGELILVPLASGIGDAEDELYTLNPTGREIWSRLDGKRTLRDVARLLGEEYEAEPEELERDVLGLVQELHRRRMLTVAGVA
jgi:hypothetical protein